MKPWVVDASPFVFLSKIERLSVLESLAPPVLMPTAVLGEILERQDDAVSLVREASGKWLEVAEVQDRLAVELLLPSLGAGEAEVIALAKERDATRVVMDDLDARRFARRVGLHPIGTLGLLLAARRRGEIPSIRNDIRKLEAAGFYASDALVTAVLEAAGE